MSGKVFNSSRLGPISSDRLTRQLIEMFGIEAYMYSRITSFLEGLNGGGGGGGRVYMSVVG